MPRPTRRSSRPRSGGQPSSRSRSPRSRSAAGETASEAPPRTIDKSRTRRALLDGALDLLEDRSLDNLGIREVTRAAGVSPAAFYRHFDTIAELGLVLVDEAFATLRQLLRGARDDVTAAPDMISRSIAVLAVHIREHPAHYRFIAREQFSAVVPVRNAIRRELRLLATELATDVARLPVVNTWPTADLVMLAEMMVDLMVDTGRRLLEVVDGSAEAEEAILAEAERRLRYLSVGAAAWRPR